MSALDWAWLDTPVGPVSVGCGAAGVVGVRYGPPPGGNLAPAGGLADAAREQLAEYFSGQRREFDLPLDWSATAGTQRHVLEVLAGTVRYGATISYGALAARAGLTATGDVLPARVVGQIMGSNPIPVIVPCHRVLASDGLGGYSGGAGPETKRWLLILEGALPPTLDWQPASPAGNGRGAGAAGQSPSG
ncbi:MAG TPA: methylated-DNA--[protein]-cysteine S-methyltransferase [Streptosporangiaceae bacterium]|nr:methylated-DNA--[protein]-cysteine S-methyltransferase [Streptosporangiaceae bacterium]